MSPILVRPVREQLEHDRVIRLLQAKYKRKFDVAINPGQDRNAPVGDEASPWYPDLVLQSQDRGRKLAGIVEVETAESVNNLEAMSQWVAFSNFHAAFHLYIPTAYVDSARRFCTELHVNVAELWAYQAVGDQIRFSLIQRSAPEPKSRAVGAPAEPNARPAAASRPAAGAKAVKNGSAGKAVAVVKQARPAAKPATKAAAKTTVKTATKSGAGRAVAKNSAKASPERTRSARAGGARAATPTAARRSQSAKAAKPAPRRAAVKAPARKSASGPVRATKRR